MGGVPVIDVAAALRKCVLFGEFCARTGRGSLISWVVFGLAELKTRSELLRVI